MNNNLSRVSSRHRKKNLNFYKWTSIFLLFLGLISGSILVYQYHQQQTLRTQLQELKEQAQRQYQLQDIHLISTNDLVNSPKVQTFFDDLLTTYSQKFAKDKNLNISHLPLKSLLWP